MTNSAVTPDSVLHGNCLDVLKTFPDNTFSAVVTDPPYGLSAQPDMKEVLRHWLNGDDYEHGSSGFMGNSWDSFVPGPKIWEEVMRVLKPGGHILSFSGCYDRTTEVLTYNGWKFFFQVTMDDEFATLNPITEEIEYQRAKEIVRQSGHKKMRRFKTNKVDLLITPNHKVFFKSMGGSPYSKWRLERADELPSAIKMKKDGIWMGKENEFFVLPAYRFNVGHGHFKIVPEIKIPMDVWLKFFGLWMAEGSATKTKIKTGYSYNIQICHFNNDTLNDLEKAIAPYFSVCRHRKQGKLRINNPCLYEHLSQFGHAWEKFIPEYVKALSPRQLRIFWEWYMCGDGCFHRGKKKVYSYTTSKKLVDGWQEVALKMGISADYALCKPKRGEIKGRVIEPRHQCYVVTFNETQNEPELYRSCSRAKNSKIVLNDVVDFDDDVFCVEVPKYHTLYVRRNGKTVWCGNTRTYDLMVTAMRMAGSEIRDQINVHCEMEGCLDWIYGQGFPKSMNVSKALDKAAGAEREVVGIRTFVDGSKVRQTAGMVGIPGSGASGQAHLTAPATDAARQWDGYGTALKPAHEPIASFTKGDAPPLEGIPFHYTAKTSTRERNIGCEHLFWKVVNDCHVRITEEEHTALKQANETRKDEAGFEPVRLSQGNIHPTVKPIMLCRWLVKLVKMPGDNLILDPFCGSGSILCACALEDCRYVGIDMDRMSVDLSLARTAYWKVHGKK